MDPRTQMSYSMYVEKLTGFRLHTRLGQRKGKILYSLWHAARDYNGT